MPTARFRQHFADARTGMEAIASGDCLALLAEHMHEVGRLAVVDETGPVIYPVNYTMVRDSIVFRTGPGSKLDAIRSIGSVSFEIDHIDVENRRGWSVVVRGRAHEITSAGELFEVRCGTLEAYPGSEQPHWVRIQPDTITGRRVSDTGRWFW